MRKICIFILLILLTAVSLQASQPISASYKISLVNPERQLFAAQAQFEFPEKMDSVVFRIIDYDNHYNGGYARYIKQLKLFTEDSVQVELTRPDSTRWVAHDVKGSYSLQYFIIIAHLTNPSEFGIADTPFFISLSGVVIGTAMLVYPDLKQDIMPVDIPFKFDLAENQVALLPNETIGHNKYSLNSLEDVYDSYWALGNYDTTTIGSEDNPLLVAIESGAFEFSQDQLLRNLRKLWRELHGIFKRTTDYKPLLFVTRFPFSGKSDASLNTGAAAEGTINILLDSKLSPEQLDNEFGLFAYNLFAQWMPFSFQPYDRLTDSWLGKGAVNYYQAVLLVRMGIITETDFINRLMSTYQVYSREYDRRRLSVRTARTLPATNAYVQTAELMTAFAVDIKLRSYERNPFSVDQLLAELAKRYSDGGFVPEEHLYELIDSLCGYYIRPFVDSCMNQSHKIDIPGLLENYGIEMEFKPESEPNFGVRFVSPYRLVVDQMDRGGPAYNAGLQKGDVILKVDGKEFSSVVSMLTHLRNKKIGKDIKVEYQRGDELMETKIKLAGIDRWEWKFAKNRTEKQKRLWQKLISSKQEE